MIQSFIDSWPLFHHAWVASWLIAVLLGGLGTIILAREQIFLGAAMAQSATCGVALVLALGGTAGFSSLQGDWVQTLFGAIMATGTALIAGVGRRHREAVTAWIFLAASAGALVAVANNPHGSEEINRLVASSLIGATGSDVVIFIGLLLGSLALLIGGGRRLATVIIDPTFAAVIGLNVTRWEIVIAVWLGSAIGVALHTAGLLYVFGCLLLPALAAREICRELRTMTLVAPIIGLAGSVVGSILANGWDLPPAHVTVLVLAGFVPLAWGVGRLVRW